MAVNYGRYSSPPNTLFCFAITLTSLPQVSDSQPSNITVTIPSSIATLDLSKAFTNTAPSLWQQPEIPKPQRQNTPSPPTLNSGTIFSDAQNLYLFGGSISVANPAINAPATVPGNALWQYSFSTQQWTAPTLNGSPVQRMTLGASVQNPTSSKSYYLGGVKNPASDPYFWTVKGATPYMTPGLLTFDSTAQTFANTSTASLDTFGTSAQGFLTLLPYLGSQGLLISFGGWSNAPNHAMNITDDQLLNPAIRQNLTNIAVYDIGSQAWYQQTATGDVPNWRYIGCSVLVSAPDNSSHSIYVYAGWGSTFAESDGDVYVLSLPSFRWIRVNSDSGERSRHQCVLAGKNTMLVVGGIVPYNDFPIPTWTAAGCDTNSTMFQQGIGLFNLNNHTWSGTWDPDTGAAPYRIHESISKVIGGTPNGAATLSTPANGWSHPELAKLFTGTTAPNSTTTTTTALPPSSLPTTHHSLRPAIIAAIAIASTIALALLLSLSFTLFLRYHRNISPTPHNTNELDAHTYVRELGPGEDRSKAPGAQVWRCELDTGVEKVAELEERVVVTVKEKEKAVLVSQFSKGYEKPLPRAPEKGMVEGSR